MTSAIFIFMLVSVLIVALILGFLLAPVLVRGCILIFDAIAHKIAYTKQNKISGSYADIKKPNDVKYGLNFRPLKGERSKSTQKCNVTYFDDGCHNNLDCSGLQMTRKPIEKSIFYPIHKVHVYLVRVYHRLKGRSTKRALNHRNFYAHLVAECLTPPLFCFIITPD